MTKIKPNFVYDKQKKKTGVILKTEEFEFLIDELEDFYDYETIKKRITKKEKTYPLEEVMAEILAKK